MFVFAHHMAVEILGREYSPHTVFEHICVFVALSLLFSTSAYGTWTILQKMRERFGLVRRV
jgi:hypothetical protein